MLISVIVPCYNCEKTIVRCLESILKQTHSDVEIIAVDDGSTDDTFEQLNKIKRLDHRLNVLKQNNLGPSSARNLALSRTTGDYITFVDSDDYLRLDAFEKMLSCARKYDADITICDYYSVFKENKLVEFHHILPEKLDGKQEITNHVIKQFYGGNMTGLSALWNKLYKSTFLENCWFDISLYRGEDWWFNMKAFEKATTIATLHEGLYYYWQDNSNSIMKRLDSNYYEEWKKARLYLTEKNKEYGFNYDNNMVYAQLLKNIHSLLIAMTKRGEDIMPILNDPFYKEIIKYDENTSGAIKLCHRMSHSPWHGNIIYKILGVLY